ncbi:hypothetical protein IJH23_00340 [Candidatus Saccharibacteria bacterium]|nr:hypothetical protein [Candidatus Saccharibacteria bacterium]
MKKRLSSKNKSGAAAFYVVAFSTLILTIVAIGFAAVIISEVTRSSNDDLSQSAYDSALAGIEDAKLAFYNYQSCLEKGITSSMDLSMGGDITCQDIIYWVEHSDGSKDYNKPCDMVAHILGRIGKYESGDDAGGVIVEESSASGNNMAQAYTCVQIKTNLSDYRGSLSSDNTMRVVKVKLDGVAANNIDRVRVSWFENDGLTDLKYNNFNSSSEVNSGVTFRSITSTPPASPPMISVQLVQTGASFNLASFDAVSDGQTNRGTVFLVPTDSDNYASKSKADNYIGAFNKELGENMVSAAQIVKSNDRTVKNLPYAVYCDPNGGTEFVCSALLSLPKPIGGERNDETFMFVVSVPYGQPNTDFALEFFCNGESCGKSTIEAAELGDEKISQAMLSGVQINIDSTGRANDLYRRVEARLDSADANFPYPLYALQLLGDDDGNSLLRKDLTTTIEYGL